MSKLSNLRNKFIVVLAVLLCTLLLLSTALLIPKNKTAEANSTSNVLNISGDSNRGFNSTNLKTLFGYIYSGSTTYDALSTNLGSGKGEVLRGYANMSTKTTVKLGGFEWNVVAASKNQKDEVIITLWLSTGAGSNTSTFSPSNFTSGYTTLGGKTYAAMEYSTSLVRTTLVGGSYVAKTTIMGGTQNENWKIFLDKYGEFIDSPVEVCGTTGYQATEIPMKSNVSQGYLFPNDAYEKVYNTTASDLGITNPPGGQTNNTWYGTMSNVQNCADYGEWKGDKLWLPSICETGFYAGNGTIGAWKIDNDDIRRTSTNAWLRSGYSMADNQGSCLTNSTEGQAAFVNLNSDIAVRPAFHLNLAKVMQLSPEDIEVTYTGAALGVPVIYSADVALAPWYATTVYRNSSSISYEYRDKEDNVVTAPVNVGEYTVKMTLNSTSDDALMGFKWESAEAGNSKTIKIKVVKKSVKVKFTPSGSNITVTSGDTDNYPTADYVTGAIADNDKTGDNAGNYPTLKKKYQNRKTFQYTDDPPTTPGIYWAIVEIDEKVYDTCNYKLADETDDYKNYVEFTVDPIKVTKPTLSSTELTYNGSAQTVEITGLSTINANDTVVVYTVKKEGGTPSAAKSDSSFDVTDEGKYIVTVSFASDDIKTTHVWSSTDKDNGTTNNFELEVNVKKKQLTVTIERDGTGGWQWQATTEVKFKVTVSGICEIAGKEEEIVLDVYYTNKDGTGRTDAKSGEEYIIPATLPKGDNYKIVCELTSADINANYELKDAVNGKIEKAFKINAAGVTFDGSSLPWVYANGDDTEQPFGEGNKVTYNNKDYMVSLASDADDILAGMGVKVDLSYAPTSNGLKGDLSAKNVSDEGYEITVHIVALTADYEYDGEVITFKWYIDKADYDLSTTMLKWQYKARGNTGDYAGGVPYEGGTNALENGKIEVFITGLPSWLEPVYSTQAIHKSFGYEIGKYTAKIISLTSKDNNYNSISELDGYSWSTLEWEIVQHKLSTRLSLWEEGDYADGKVTKSPTLGTSYYTVHLVYEYYETPDRSDTPKTDISELGYEEGTEKTYYVLALIDSSYPDDVKNWALDNGSTDSNNPYTFIVGANRIAVEINVTCGGAYDGTPQGAKIELVGSYEEIDLDSFEITYYTAGGEVLTGAPTDAGSYSVSIALKEQFTDKYYIKSKKTYDLVITTRLLEVPAYEGKLTYNGEEQDIAKLVGLPDGWENYIEITINGNISDGKVKDAGSYNITFKIRDGIKDGNVAWNTTSNKTMPRTLQITVDQLVLHAKSWIKNGYYTALEFAEENGDKFVTYTVKNANGDLVTESEFYAHQDDEYIIEVSVKEEHGDNVKIVYAAGVDSKLKFIGSSTNEGDAAELENSKQAAKEELEKEAKAKKDAIDADNNLTAEEKAAAKAEIDKELEDGKAEIDKATDKDGVDKALEDGKKEIDDTAELVQKKGAAKAELQKDADKKNAEIEASDMTDEEKAKAKAEVEAELQKGLDNINKAASESEINSSYTESKTIIEGVKIIRKSSSSFPWWIIAVVAGVLAVAVIVIVVLKRRKATAEGDDYYDDEYYGDEDEEYDYEDEEEIIDDGYDE